MNDTIFYINHGRTNLPFRIKIEDGAFFIIKLLEASTIEGAPLCPGLIVKLPNTLSTKLDAIGASMATLSFARPTSLFTVTAMAPGRLKVLSRTTSRN